MNTIKSENDRPWLGTLNWDHEWDPGFHIGTVIEETFSDICNCTFESCSRKMPSLSRISYLSAQLSGKSQSKGSSSDLGGWIGWSAGDGRVNVDLQLQ